MAKKDDTFIISDDSILSEDTENEAFVTGSDVIISVSRANKLTQFYFEEIEDEDEDEIFSESRQALYDLIAQFVRQPYHNGSDDQFHNLSVTLAKNEEYGLAIDVLECGLNIFPNNVDMLSDYLQYGTKGSSAQKLQEYADRLKAIPRRRWTWRGFSFLVDYLIYLHGKSNSDEEMTALEEEMLQLTADFKKYFPYSEDAYKTEADVYACVNDIKKETEILKTAIDNEDIVCPKCALRYADIMFDRGKYDDAALATKQAMLYTTQTQSSVREGYLYYLYALCLVVKIQKSILDGETADKVAVEEVYRNFNHALVDLGDTSYEQVIVTKATMLKNLTSIDISEDYDRLVECLEDNE